jgi:cephalosporin hydroxylase
MKVEVSTGELLDKFSILQIKSANITDEGKLKNIIKEMETLEVDCEQLLADKDVRSQYNQLLNVNNILWNTEDAIREKERLQQFDEEFVLLARSVYINNDARAEIKKNINILTNSELIEEKSYRQYTTVKTSQSKNAEEILALVKRQPTDIPGLKWRPSLEPEISDDTDWFGPPTPWPERHFSDLDHRALEYAYSLLDETPKLIVEIGVDRSENYENASTSTLIKIKPKNCTYVGIDIEDKSSLDDAENNVYTLRNDSADYEKLYDFMKLHGHEQIDFMFVDGWHSINQVLKEWKYWEKMIPNGVMAFHDINYHPGPVAVLDAIDQTQFTVEYFGRQKGDWGVGVVKRIKI